MKHAHAIKIVDLPGAGGSSHHCAIGTRHRPGTLRKVAGALGPELVEA